MEPLTAKQAALLFGVSPATVRWWARENLIHVAGRGRYNAALYRYDDLVEAEHAMRASGKGRPRRGFPHTM